MGIFKWKMDRIRDTRISNELYINHAIKNRV